MSDQKEIEELLNAVAASIYKDAERYRWLRAQNWSDGALCVVANPKEAVKLGHDCPSLARLDEAIDAALREALEKAE